MYPSIHYFVCSAWSVCVGQSLHYSVCSVGSVGVGPARRVGVGLSLDSVCSVGSVCVGPALAGSRRPKIRPIMCERTLFYVNAVSLVTHWSIL